MQVDIERLFTNTCPIMVNESDTFSKWRASRSIFCDKGHLNVKKTAQYVTISYNTTLCVFSGR